VMIAHLVQFWPWQFSAWTANTDAHKWFAD